MRRHDHEKGGLAASARREPSAPETQLAAQRALASQEVRPLAPDAILHLQRAAGNAGVAQLISADQEGDGGASPVHDVVASGGSPLGADTRVAMESQFGEDFGDVRVHHDGAADASARSLDAQAYTVGSDIVFAQGAFDESSGSGQRTLAHELTHVVQQRSGPVDGTPIGDGIALSHPSDRFEQQAERTADRVMGGEAGVAVQREGADSVGDEDQVQTLALQRQTSTPTPAQTPVPTPTATKTQIPL